MGIWCIGFIARLLQCAGVRSVFGLTGAPGHVPGRDQGVGRLRWFSISHPGGSIQKNVESQWGGSTFYTSILYSFQEGMKRQKWDIKPQTCIYHHFYPTETITKAWKWMSCHQNEMVTCVDQNLDMDQATYRRQGTTDGLLMLNKLS